MFRASSTDESLDPRLERILKDLSPDIFGPDEDLLELDFATVEQRAHEVGRRVARQLAEDAAAKQAQALEGPQPCPTCERPSPRSIKARELLTQDGAISLQETECYCSHCRRAFFPQQSEATLESSAIQPSAPDQGGLHGDGKPLVRGGNQGFANQHDVENFAASSPDPLPRGRRRTRRGTKNAN